MPALCGWQKGGAMLQFPTNFQPENQCIDTISDESYDVSFTFNGDAMYGAKFNVYDYKTGNIIDTFSYYTRNYTPYKFNGEQFLLTHNLTNDYINTRDYVIQAQIFQGDSVGDENVCDMKITNGTIQGLGADSTKIVIEANIDSIYEWGYDSITGKYLPTMNDERIVSEMQIEIDNERHTILSYNPTTGEVELSEAFTTISLSAGTKYRIYSNYIITPQYLLMCRRKPNLYFNLWLTIPQEAGVPPWFNTQPLEFGINGQAGGWDDDNSLSYFNLKLYYSETQMSYTTQDDISQIETESELLDDSGYIYSEKLSYTTRKCWATSSGYLYPIVTAKTRNGAIYKSAREYVLEDISTEVTTNGQGDFKQQRGDFVIDGFAPTAEVKLLLSIGGVTPSEEKEPKRMGIFRENAGVWQFIQQVNINRLGEAVAWDNTAPLNTDVRYKIVPINEFGDVCVSGIFDVTVNTKANAVSIMGLIPVSDGIYNAGNEWLFEIGLNDPTLNFNLSNNLHTSYVNYPSVSRMGSDYVSGNFSADLAYIGCPNNEFIDNISMIRAWRRFIKKYDAYLLKDLKGNVFVIQITDIPTLGWQEQNPMRPTSVSFNWVEVEDADKIQVILEGGI